MAGQLGRVQRKHQRVGRGHLRPRARLHLSAVLDADQQLLRWPSSGRQPVRREPHLRAGENRSSGLALPGGPPRHLGLRLPGASDPGRHHGERSSYQGRHPGEQAGIHLRLRPQDRSTGLADRRTSGRRLHGAGRADLADAAVSDKAPRV